MSPLNPCGNVSTRFNTLQLLVVALINLTIILLELMGVFTMACAMWHVHPIANKTICEFVAYFTAKNKECLRKLTTSQTGFHSANAAMIAAPKPLPANALPVQLAPPTTITINNGISMYYCWIDGLGFNCTHMSTTCSNPADGHCLNATVKNMPGSNNTIMLNCHHPKANKTK